MAVAVEMDFKGATLEQYNAVVEKMGFAPGGKGAPHGLFHWVTTTDDGIRVVDVWDSREAFEAFAHEQIEPLTADIGIPAPPEVRISEVHNYLTAG